LLPPTPKPMAQRPPGLLAPISMGIVPLELPVCPIESVDLAMEIAEVADQQMVAEPGETGWRHDNSPWRGEAAASDQLFDEVPVLTEDRTAPAPKGALIWLGRPAGA
jgi:hypothetical protein